MEDTPHLTLDTLIQRLIALRDGGVSGDTQIFRNDPEWGIVGAYSVEYAPAGWDMMNDVQTPMIEII